MWRRLEGKPRSLNTTNDGACGYTQEHADTFRSMRTHSGHLKVMIPTLDVVY